MTLLAASLAETGASIVGQFIALAAVAIVLIQQMQFRPQLFDYVFLAALIAMLSRESYGRRAPLWLAVPILTLWANLHGGFFVGLAALGIYSVACGALGMARGAGSHCALRPTAITVVAAAGTLCNPWGIGEWIGGQAEPWQSIHDGPGERVQAAAHDARRDASKRNDQSFVGDDAFDARSADRGVPARAAWRRQRVARDCGADGCCGVRGGAQYGAGRAGAGGAACPSCRPRRGSPRSCPARARAAAYAFRTAGRGGAGRPRALRSAPNCCPARCALE